MIKCPNCGASHYSEGPSSTTAVYYMPIYKNGVNVNPDRNTTTTEAHCYECGCDFIIKSQGGEVWTESIKSSVTKPPVDVNITEIPNAYVPVETQNAVATINIETGEALRPKYKWEVDIERLEGKINKLRQDLSDFKDLIRTMIS